MGDGTTGREKYRVNVVSSPEPMKLANRRNVAETSGRRRVKSRAYCSTSTESFAYPVMGPRAVMSSVNRAGSSALAPYTAVLDFMTSFLTVGTLWHAANSWSEPITLISFIAIRPPTRGGVAMIEWRTTASILDASGTFSIRWVLIL